MAEERKECAVKGATAPKDLKSDQRKKSRK